MINNIIPSEPPKEFDFDVLPRIYGLNFNLERAVYKAKIELEIAFMELHIPRPGENMDSFACNYLDNYESMSRVLKFIKEGIPYHYEDPSNVGKRPFTPEPPGGLSKPVLSSNRDYYTVRSLWDLMHFLDESLVEIEYYQCYDLGEAV